ncbi:PREDICTED: phosphatidate phosphatase LPIN3 [Pseudopodoces humilis]|uniref:phosphatidate phosphatase LPIN3 n=1 Tax=Pseudopodoces humilis TaxID=181119 RepID=UPI0006B8271B|nr:PREDICTED: phosphatidate phosphatase LPIN3 [Pseudopodoces humilis]
MNYVGQLAENVFVTMKELYQNLNPATLSGCIDVVVVRQPDNSFKCSPFHVRFGKLGVLRSKEKVVDIEINGEPVDLHMKLGDNGEAFFVEESQEHEEATSAGVIVCKRRQHKRRLKMELDSDSDSCDETKSELPAPSDAACSSFADLPEETALLQSREIYPYSDGELLEEDSFVLSHQSSPKSDSELDIKPQESFALGAESLMRWTWGKLPQAGNSISRLKDILHTVTAKRFLGVYSVPQEKQEGDENVVPEVQPDVEPLEGATAPRQAGSEGPESQLESQGRQGSIRNPHLDPSAIYLGDLSKTDHEPVALYISRSDTKPSLRPVTDPSNPLCIQLSSTSPDNSPMDSDLMPTVALSLCGGLRSNRQISHEKFMEHMVSYQQFAENPRLVDDPNLVIMINKKYYNWAVAGPIILALQAFQRNIPESIIDKLVKEKMLKKDRRWWFSWRRREFPAEGQQPRPGKASMGALQHDPAQQSQEEEESSSDSEPQHPGDMLTVEAPAQKHLPTYKKSLRLSSEQIGRLNLQDGPNEVAFSVTTQYQGTCRCEATIYLWNWNEKVVISDIDGTITKSDALGHILPQLGKDWTHRGIVTLFHKIHLNGYKFLYCSARAIGMAHITKGYLKWVNEQGCGLPMGPMLLSPSSLLSAFHREVIEKKPEVFKVTCLTDIRKLFPTKCPFYAGFGNRPNDVYAYKQVGLPESHIFTVNHKGELIQELAKNQKSTYEQLSELVEVFFPPV